MKNKKGFTLIELLAVIVILAILATASFTLVLPQIEKARKRSFISEAANIIESAEVYFANHISNEKVRCVKISTLAADGVLKNKTGKYGNVYYVTEKLGSVPAGTFKIRFNNSSFQTSGNSSWYSVDQLRNESGDATDKVVKATATGTGTGQFNDVTKTEKVNGNQYDCE